MNRRNFLCNGLLIGIAGFFPDIGIDYVSSSQDARSAAERLIDLEKAFSKAGAICDGMPSSLLAEQRARMTRIAKNLADARAMTANF